MNKYEKIVELQNKLYIEMTGYQEIIKDIGCAKAREQYPDLRKNHEANLDAVVNCLLENFHEADPNCSGRIAQIFENNINVLDPVALAQESDRVVGIAVIRYALSTKRVPLQRSDVFTKWLEAVGSDVAEVRVRQKASE